jgi:hypothetical protein
MIPLGRGTGDGEDTGFGPETAGIIVIERQVEELAGFEAGHGPLWRKINGIDMIAVIGDFIYQATEFLWGGHLRYTLSGHEVWGTFYMIIRSLNSAFWKIGGGW